MDTTLITKIFAPKKDGTWKLGTAYPIAKNLVLTARHVVDFPERDTQKNILLKWTDHQHVFGEHEQEKSEIVFNGGDSCDIVILHCITPPQAQISTEILARNLPTSWDKWESFGYPELGVNATTGSHDKVSLIGVFHAPDQVDHHINLTTESDAVEKEDWQGVSGAPVFHSNNKRLYAIIIKTPRNRKDIFKAVSIPHLFENPQFCAALKQPIDEAIAEQKQALVQEIKSNVKRLLLKNFSDTQLRECLKLADNKKIDDIVDELNLSVSVLDALSTLSMILEKHTPSSAEDMREISGWLLLNSVDATWWFHNQQRMQQVTGTFGLEKPDYIEIIISRSLLRPAQYGFFEGHGKRPKPRHHNGQDVLSPLTFDSSPKAMMDELLTPIYQDLWGELPPKASHAEILDEIIDKASSKCRVLDKMSKGKLIYYLVGQEHLKLLEEQDWFMEKQAQLAACLRFICCSPVAKSTGQNPCTEGQGAVLAQLSELLEKIDKLGK